MMSFSNYLNEKNISLKEFSKITDIKENRLNLIFNNQAFFDKKESAIVSAFLGVSENELFHGVLERKGELTEVAEQNNLNHFRYFVKTRLKNAKRLLNAFSTIGGLSVVAIAFIYIALMFVGVSGLPTILRSMDVLLLCFIVPVFCIGLLVDIARYKITDRKTTMFNKINIEAVGISVMLLVFSITGFINGFIPVEALILTALGSVVLSLLSFITPFKKTPLKNRGLQFVVYMSPIALLIAAEAIVGNYFAEMTPGEGVITEALEYATILIFFVFGLIIWFVSYFSLVQFFNIFVKGAGEFFKPSKKAKSIGKGKLATYIIGWLVLAVVTFICIFASQGVYLKYMYTYMFDGQEDSVNWTSELVTDYEAEFKKGECDVIEFDGMEIKIPKAYRFDNKTEYSDVYKKDEEHIIMFRRPYDELLPETDFDLFDEDFGDGKYTEEQIQDIKDTFVESFGFYPKSYYEWQKLNGMVTLDDIDIFNPKKAAVLSTIFIMKANLTVADSQYYLYENGDLYATITISKYESKEKGDREMVSVSFGSTGLEYTITMSRPYDENNKTIEEVTKILNSITVN